MHFNAIQIFFITYEEKSRNKKNYSQQ